MKRTMRPRAAIVGAGLMGRWHAHSAILAGARITVVADLEQTRAARLARRYPDCRATTELAEALDVADVVHVCTPAQTHVAIAQQALRAGRHVLVEKPIAPTAAETVELFRTAESQRVLLCPIHQVIFQDGVQAALNHLRRIGPLRDIAITICSAGGVGSTAAAREQVAVEILPHPLSLLSRLVAGALPHLEWSVRYLAPGEIRALTQAGDVSVSILVSMAGRPTRNRLQLIGERGTVHVDLFHGFAVTEGPAVSRARKAAQPFTHSAATIAAAAANAIHRIWRREPAYPGLRRLTEQFYTAAIDGGACPIAPDESLTIAVACDRLTACLRSSVARPRPGV